MDTQQLIDILTGRVCTALVEEFDNHKDTAAVIAWNPVASSCVANAFRYLLPGGSYTTYTFSDQEGLTKTDENFAKRIGLTLEEAKKAMRITFDILFDSTEFLCIPSIIVVDGKKFSVSLKKVMVVEPSS